MDSDEKVCDLNKKILCAPRGVNENAVLLLTGSFFFLVFYLLHEFLIS